MAACCKASASLSRALSASFALARRSIPNAATSVPTTAIAANHGASRQPIHRCRLRTGSSSRWYRARTMPIVSASFGQNSQKPSTVSQPSTGSRTLGRLGSSRQESKSRNTGQWTR